jgi:hypothetical protein
MKTSYFICGTDTGRTSTQQLEPPIRPYTEVKSEGKKKKKGVGFAFQTLTKHGDVGQDVRSYLVPDKDFVYINVDSSQAEARVCALLADDDETLALYDTHDIHAMTASWCFGGDENKYAKKLLGFECPERFIGKTVRHAGHLDIGKHELMMNVNTDARKYNIPIRISEYKANQILEIFHKMCPKIRSVYHETVKELLRNGRYIKAPSGRGRTFHDRWNPQLWKAAYSFIPQATVGDNTKRAGMAIRERTEYKYLRFVGEAHDSLLLLVHQDALQDYAPVIIEEMEKAISFEQCSIQRHDLVIPCELEIGRVSYKDLEKFKLTA